MPVGHQRRSMAPAPTARRATAFTLVELLVVISIIALLIAMLLPALAQARKVTHKSMCLANQRQIAQLTHYYVNDNRDFVPPSYDGTSTAPAFWFQKLAMRYLNVRMAGASIESACGDGRGQERIFICPTAPTIGAAGLFRTTGIAYGWNYLALTHIDFAYSSAGGQTARFQQMKRPEQTILLTDSNPFFNSGNGYVVKPNQAWWWYNLSYMPASRHLNTANYAMGDGHAVSLAPEVAAVTDIPYWRMNK